ncbi:hypothetical protein ABIA54_004658 [Pseudomonas sp. EB276 TE3739]|uniref:KAP family NTPase n=1 Tax=Pseudomonas TaxID=286 RepID=UPI00209E7661|nr:KAP family NTPase [Pseudomonas koreensis]MCP1476496.1 hypothetical protein [Pseudomonas koreensis]
MANVKPKMKMPEFLVFFRALVLGFVAAEVWRVASCLGENFAPLLWDVGLVVQLHILLIVLVLCFSYALTRGAFIESAKMVRSFRVDLLIAVGVGIWVNELISPLLLKFHMILSAVDPYWTPALLVLLCTVLISPLIQQYWPRTKKTIPQLYFIADEEIFDKSEDVLLSETQAKSFAETVLASGAHAGLVFGVDGPWGVGKTSFINLAERHWENAVDKAIVVRFEPLRYASEPDLAERLIRDLSAAIQREVFAPEFRPAASRYSRLIKGKADISFLGFKLSLEPSQETVDELLDDVDEVLRRIDRRVIIVIDDLDRLDTKTINSVLFATRRTFKLSQATYVLCYDTEILAGNHEEDSRAREFLEKFVTVKISLFVDSSGIRDFLLRDWQRETKQLGSIPSDTMVKLGAILIELASILNGDHAASYLPLVGNLRKIKRFVNAMLLMQLERSDLARTDFNKRDLINLILLHLSYPGLFRRIYAGETEGRAGFFSLRRIYAQPDYSNSAEFSKELDGQPEPAKFLLKQLFDVETLNLPARGEVEESVLATRACFNQESFRNLENYLKLIVRFATPEPQKTYVLYHNAVEQVRKGTAIDSVLMSQHFRLEHGQYSHDQFWRIFVNKAYDIAPAVAEDAFNTLVSYLPKYSTVGYKDIGLRQRSVYSLIRLLDRAGWGQTVGKRTDNSPENIVEIAWRIFGEQTYVCNGLLKQLVGGSRGVLGWNDLMLFRLQCCADRQGQVYNLHAALITNQDPGAPTNGSVEKLALMGMRKLSQEVFALFKTNYIDAKENFFAAVDNTRFEDFLGEAQSISDAASSSGEDSLSRRVLSARCDLKSFVIYQLINSALPHGRGVGCGYYDMVGKKDTAGIASLMNKYVFEFCFNPDVHEDNIFHFIDHCLANLSNSFFTGSDEAGYVATQEGLLAGFDPKSMRQYWLQYRDLIRKKIEEVESRFVFTSTYTASYREDLDGVFSVLDEFAEKPVV